MDKHELHQYRSRLLDGGISYATVKRHLRELLDHYRDLERQALEQGVDPGQAGIAAWQQLGNLDQMAKAMLAQPGLRSMLHRHPALFTLVLPLFAYLLICIGLGGVLLFYAISTGALGAEGLPDRVPLWLVSSFDTLILLQKYVFTPAIALGLAFIGIRHHLPAKFWMTGLVLVCLLGSGTVVQASWPDPGRQQMGSVGVSYMYTVHPLANPSLPSGSLQRLLLNLLLCGSFAWYWRSREQTLAWTGV